MIKADWDRKTSEKSRIVKIRKSGKKMKISKIKKFEKKSENSRFRNSESVKFVSFKIRLKLGANEHPKGEQAAEGGRFASIF